MNKKKILIISTVSVFLVCASIYGIVRIIKGNAKPVEVVSVSSLNSGYFGYEMPTSGMITANATQVVHLDSNDLVDKVYVKKGDKVKVGDKLLSYDATLLELELEAAKLERKSLELQIKTANDELEKLKRITPVSDQSYASSSNAVLLNHDITYTAAASDEETMKEEAALVEADLKKTTDSEKTALAEADLNQGEETAETVSPETAPAETAPTEKPSTEAAPTEVASTEAAPEAETDKKDKKPQKSPLSEIKAYSKLKYNSKFYKGTGTKEDPYVFFCKDGTTIEASFMNKVLGFNESGTNKKKGGMRENGEGSYVVLEIREGDSVQGGFVKSLSINGTSKADKPYAPDITWTFTSEGIKKNVPDVDEPESEDNYDDIFDDFGEFGDDVYTASELKKAIQEKEDDIKELKLDQKESKIAVQQAKRKVDATMIKATINGVVKSVGDPAVGEEDGEGFLVVTSNEGLYVKGSISELKLGKVKVGSTMTGNSYESGTTFTAEITEISEYPDTSQQYGYDGNRNASQYPFLAYIENSKGLNNNEYVDLSIEEDRSQSSGVYLMKAYIRSENGQSYVYKADENNRLVKQYIKTGATFYSTSVEILSGLTNEDKIAFPYGKNVVEGAKTVENEDGMADMLMG